MSGEITLRGRVLPVGGIKEKLLAAHRERIKEAIIPLDNKPDLKDLPKKVKDDIKIHFVENMDEVLEVALTRELPKKRKIAASSDLPEGEEEGGGPQEPPVAH